MNKEIKAFLNDRILEEEIELNDNTALYSSGLISSLSHLKLINFLEKKFEIDIQTNRIRLDNFDTIDHIVKFIQNQSQPS